MATSTKNQVSGQPINSTKKKDVLLIDPRLLRVIPGFNTRVDYGDMEGLCNSIIENGVENPFKGYKEGDFYFVVDGHRRQKAVEMAMERGNEIARVPFISSRKKTEEERIFDILISNDGKPLTGLELGETYKRLLACGLTVAEIAKRTGRTYRHVSEMITVASSSTEVKGYIQSGQISATLVAEIKAKVKDVDEAEELIKDSVKQSEVDGKKKVTKKDIQKVTPKLGVVTYTEDEVIGFLEQQRKACADYVLPDEACAMLIMRTDLVLKRKV